MRQSNLPQRSATESHNNIVSDFTLHKIMQVFLLVGLLYLCVKTLALFVVPVLWSTILVYATWPLHMRLRGCMPRFVNVSALISTVLLVLLIVAPMVFLMLIVQDQTLVLYQKAQAIINGNNMQLPQWVKDIPVAGKQLNSVIVDINNHPEIVADYINKWLQGHLAVGRQLLSFSLHMLGLSVLTLVSAFFLYKDGDKLLAQIKQSLQLVMGYSPENYFVAAGATTRGVVNGMLLTALAQAILAGCGYLVVSFFVDDMPSVLWLTVVTFVAGLIPLATPIAWGSFSIWLFTNGHEGSAIGLLIWGVLAISTIDNIVRPLVVSSAAQVPFIIILFGILGGITAFGFVGAFLGPVLLAVLLTLWKEWLLHKQFAQQP